MDICSEEELMAAKIRTSRHVLFAKKSQSQGPTALATSIAALNLQHLECPYITCYHVSVSVVQMYHAEYLDC